MELKVLDKLASIAPVLQSLLNQLMRMKEISKKILAEIHEYNFSKMLKSRH